MALRADASDASSRHSGTAKVGVSVIRPPADILKGRCVGFLSSV